MSMSMSISLPGPCAPDLSPILHTAHHETQVQAPGPYIIHYGIDWHVNWIDAAGVNRAYDFNKLLYLSLDPAVSPSTVLDLGSISACVPLSTRGCVRGARFLAVWCMRRSVS